MNIDLGVCQKLFSKINSKKKRPGGHKISNGEQRIPIPNRLLIYWSWNQYYLDFSDPSTLEFEFRKFWILVLLFILISFELEFLSVGFMASQYWPCIQILGWLGSGCYFHAKNIDLVLNFVPGPRSMPVRRILIAKPSKCGESLGGHKIPNGE